MSSPLEAFRDRLSLQLEPWHRSFQFWTRVVNIYAGYKVCQFRAALIKDVAEQESIWERQHEVAADKLYSMCYDLGGMYLKAAQLVGKPDLAPAAWVKKLVTLCDKAPSTPFEVVQHILEKELGKSFTQMFESFDADPVGSASIAQVHRARLKGGKRDVAVKVQHPGVHQLMMIDIRNLQSFALFLQKTEIKFDLFSLTKEVEKQVGFEFDFLREADAMEKIHHFLHSKNKKLPVLVPRVHRELLTRHVLVMDFLEGIPIVNLGKEMAKRGINPGGKIATAAKQKILKNLTLAYGQMILESGFFHADPHPGNILICKDSEVALLDYGQVKHLPDNLRLGYASLLLSIADNNPKKALESYRQLGIKTIRQCVDEEKELFKLAKTMFDTQLPPGVTVMSPFAEDSSLRKIEVESFPEELFCILRTIQLLRGLSTGLGINYSCSEQWRPIAEAALYKSGRLEATELKTRKRGFLRRLLWRT